MIHRCKMFRSVFAPLLIVLHAATASSDVATPNADFYRYLFAFPLPEVIQQPEHFGLANGTLALGINPKSTLDIQGIFAPPYVSSDFRFTANIDGTPLKPTSGSWLPVSLTAKHALNPVQMETSIQLVYGQRAILVSANVFPRDGRKFVQLSGSFAGALDQNLVWEFARPASKTKTVRSREGDTLLLTQGDYAVALTWGTNPGMPKLEMQWDATTGQWSCDIAVDQQNYMGHIQFAIAIGKRDDAINAAKQALQNPKSAVEDELGARTKALFDRVPRFESDNKSLERLYFRSLVPALLNKWQVPEFKLNPYYSTGSINGGCLCNYLWDFGEVWEILPIIDPEATKAHIKHFLSVDLTKHFAFLPITGEGFGPWYMVNQEKITGLVYYYVMVTGDTAFLTEQVNGRSILEHMIEHAMYGDDASKPVALIDYGESNSHLELRKDLKYNHVMPDLNGRRYNNYTRVAKLSEIMGKPRPDLIERAEALKRVLHDELWDPQAKWFAFKHGDGRKEMRYTCQMFKLFNSPVLTDESTAGLLSHWNTNEFLGDYGLHSLAKGDPAYDENDVDNGGPGACTGFAPQIMERLYNSGHPAEADDMLARILWWGEKLPYWGDSLYADRPDYRKDTPLQCMIDGLAVAQMYIFGLFGIAPNADGSITISPHLPSIAKHVALHNVKLRGHKFDLLVDNAGAEIRLDGKSDRIPVGETFKLPARR